MPAHTIVPKYRWLTVDNITMAMMLLFGINHTLKTIYHIDFGVKNLFLFISVILLFRTIYFCSIENQIKTIISVSFIGSEVTLFILPLVLLPKIIKSVLVNPQQFYKLKTPQLVILFYVAYSVLLIICNNIFDFSFFSIFFWFLISGAGLFIFIYYSQFEYSPSTTGSIFSHFKKIVLFQFVILILQALIHRQFIPRDDWTGSFENSLMLGFYLIMLLFFYILPPMLEHSKNFFRFILSFKNFVPLLGLCVIIFFNDSKVVILAFVVSLFFYLPVLILLKLKFHLFNISIVKTCFITLFMWLMIPVFYLSADYYVRTVSKESIDTILDKYTGTEKRKDFTNLKYIMYKRVYVDMFEKDKLKWFFGAGPGKLGSRTSNMLAYDIFYKEKGQFNLPSFIPPYSTQWVKENMADLWTSEVALTSRFRSTTLSFPFAGLVSIKGEMGIIGLFGFLIMLCPFFYYLLKYTSFSEQSEVRRWAMVLSIFWFSLPLHMIFDNIQEKPQIMLPMFLLTAVIIGQRNKSN